MNKRKFIKTAGIIATGSVMLPYFSCNTPSSNEGEKDQPESKPETGSEFIIPGLVYSFDALEPNIDVRTMEIHHGKHHAGYVRKLNKALEGHNLAGKTIEEICALVTDEDTGVRNNGGGHYNHTLFWESLKPNGGAPTGKIADALKAAFGSYEQFQEAFSKSATSVFGSGWAWLCKGEDGTLFVSSTPNQDNPLMKNLVETPGSPILGIDVWEHAYYLNYQNRRGDYVKNFFNIINWDKLSERLG
ncbi:MAG: superoxide dismutase [Bacteroidota bacterium]